MGKIRQVGDFHQQLSLPELQIKHLNTQDGATCTLSGYKLELGLLAQILLCSQVSGSAEPSRHWNSIVPCLQGSSPHTQMQIRASVYNSLRASVNISLQSYFSVCRLPSYK